MIEYVDVVATVGFPIAVTCYLLYERNQTTKELKCAIQDLHVLIAERL